jgi:TolB-like protein/DNA-binding SARP family transcriptional activator
MTRLYVLGPAEIRAKNGTLDLSFLAGSKRLALLIFLILSKPFGFHRRDNLLPMFWPEHGQKSARNALSNILYHLRKNLGQNAVINRGTEEVCINQEHFWCDVLSFEEKLKNGEYRNALELYRGDLLKGFYVPQVSAEVELWLDNERNRLSQLATEGAWYLADKAENAGNHNEARLWTKKAAELNPSCDVTYTRVIKTLDRIGDWKGAQKEFKNFALRLNNDWDEEPPEDMLELMQEVKRKGFNGNIFAPRQIENFNSISINYDNCKRRIAVMPFETLGQEKASVFTDAIHADILTKLSNISGLKVISRASVLKYRTNYASIRDISRDLKVEWILNGEVQEIADQIQVNVRLVNARKDEQVWAQNYLMKLSANNIFAIQAEITHKIASALEAKISKLEKDNLGIAPTQDLESYCLQAQGRWYLDQRTEKGMRSAISCFEKALLLDSQYALSWVGLADTWVLMQDYGYEEFDIAIPKAEFAAEKAMEYAPYIAETHTSFSLLYGARRDGPNALRKLKQAIEIRPSYAEAQNWLSWCSQLMGDAQGGLEYAIKAVELNPLSPEAVSNLSLSWLTNGEFEKARKEANRVVQLQNEWTTGHFYKGVACYHLKKYKKSIELLKDLQVLWAGSGPLLTLIMAYIKTGKTEIAINLSKQLNGEKDIFSRAIIQAALGKNGSALELLQRNNYWGHWEVLATHHLYPEELSIIRKTQEFHNVIKSAKLSWNVEV